MPGSTTSVPPSPSILTYVLSVGGLIASLMLTAFGFSNNAWIVLARPNMDEFQRGIRGHDCYKLTHEPEGQSQSIKCLPWGFEDKSAKFPDPFNEALEASYVVHGAGLIAKLILLSQIFWLAYTIGHCCSQKFSDRLEKFRLIFFHIIVIPVGLWIILFGLIVFETYTEKILPALLMKPEYAYRIGNGCWMFFLGGLLPFMIAVHCLFGEQMDASKERLIGLLQHRHRVPVNEEEMVPPA
ncbi:unnamed protein product [Caenorhabditis sp. 36 PRJEB53466]|nr:unnamed protein product [Caenorhabditis sp. 36 PRJEB53466]